MTPSRRTLWAWLGAWPLAAILVPAGGLGLAPLAGLIVAFSAPVRASWQVLRNPPLTLILPALALGWFCLSALWSPYERYDELWKLALLTPLFCLLPLTANGLEPRHLPLARAGMVFGTVTILTVLTVEAVTRGDMTLSYKVGVEGFAGAREDVQGFVDRTLSRGTTPAVMFAGVVAVMAWTTGQRALQALAALIALAAGFLAFSFNVHANGAAFIVGLAVCALAMRWPRLALPALLIAIAALIGFAPLIFLAVAGLADEQLRAAIPLSWEWRLEIWEYALSRIGEQPVTGHGLGAARVLTAESEIRGMRIELLPLHAHNAGLTIWLETGLAGVILAASGLFAIAVRLWQAPLRAPLCVMVCWVVAVWFTNIAVTYGVWQEWHHAALAFGIAMAVTAARNPLPARNLRSPR